MKRAPFKVQGLLALEASFFGLDFEVAEPAPFRKMGKTAVVEIQGPLTQHACWFWDSYEDVERRVSEALASDCERVVLKIDSPGGEVGGAFDLARALRDHAAKASKELVAFANGRTLSAGYAIACAADRIVVSDTAAVGSVGVIASILDVTAQDKMFGVQFAIVSTGKRKADGNPHVPLTEDALVALQGQIDIVAGVFYDLVGEARRMSAASVRALEASVFVGKDAVRIGLADDVARFDELIGELETGKKPLPQAAAGEESMSEYKDALANLRKTAKGEGDEAKKAKAALKAMGEDEEEKKDDDGDKKAEGDDDKKDDAKDDEKKDDKDAKAAAGSDLSLAATVQSLTARLDAKEEAEERAKLMASRPDFAPDVVKFLATQSLSSVRKAVETFERRPVPARSQAAAALAAAQPSAVATRGAEQGEGGGGPRDYETEKYSQKTLDEEMGLRVPTTQIKHEGTRMFLGVMTPDQARAHQKEMLEKEKAQRAPTPTPGEGR